MAGLGEELVQRADHNIDPTVAEVYEAGSTDACHLDRLAILAGRSWRAVDLPGGLTNHNVRVTTDDGGPPLDVVVRCSSSDAGLLGIDRDAEHANTLAGCGGRGRCARCVDYRPDLGMLVIGFLPGQALDDADFADAGVLSRAADACRRLHAGPRFAGDFDMFARQAATSRRCGSAASRCRRPTTTTPTPGPRYGGRSRPPRGRRCRATTTCWPRTSSTTASGSG